MMASCSVKRTAGPTSATRNTSDTASAKVSVHARASGFIRSRTKVSRMCSPRRNAIAAPSMPIQRNSTLASSSVQPIGLWNT